MEETGVRVDLVEAATSVLAKEIPMGLVASQCIRSCGQPSRSSRSVIARTGAKASSTVGIRVDLVEVAVGDVAVEDVEVEDVAVEDVAVEDVEGVEVGVEAAEAAGAELCPTTLVCPLSGVQTLVSSQDRLYKNNHE
jgi:hypothetical protein